LTRLDFCSALICDFTRFSAGSVPKLFPSPFFRKLLIFDLRFDRFSIVLFRACAQVPIAKSTVDLSGRNVRPSSGDSIAHSCVRPQNALAFVAATKFGMSGFDPAWPPQHRGERELLPL
jgi:hypothetical protein